MLYSVFTTRKRLVPVVSRWGDGPADVSFYEQEENAYGKVQYFTSLTKAQGFAQQYAPVPLVWEKCGDEYLTSSYKDINFQIELMDVDLDTRDMPPLPAKFTVPHSFGD